MEKYYILVDVDTQYDFMDKQGALFAPADTSVVDNISILTRLSLPRIGSVDSHAYDAWEFQANGGPFPAHCIKGTQGWLKPASALPSKIRFVPMGTALSMGEDIEGEGNRAYTSDFFAQEVTSGISVYFEKEVYSLFANPFADRAIDTLVYYVETVLKRTPVFAVYGYCTGGFCVDAAALGLAKKGHTVELILDATAPLDVKGGIEKTTLPDMKKAGIKIASTGEVVETRDSRI